jgi:DNA-binding NarL/FixJ family response regulator
MVQLSEDEERLIELVAAGWDNQTIADHLCMELQSLGNKLHKVYRKLGFAGKKGDKRVMVANWWNRYSGN